MMEINIRKETLADYRIVEELTREAFWGSMEHPTCDGEHLIVHKLRNLPSFVEDLDFVAEVEGRIAGHIIYSLAKVVMPDNREIEVLNFGPISVHPDYKRLGVGSALMRLHCRGGKIGIPRNYFLWASRLLPEVWIQEGRTVWNCVLRRGKFGCADGDGTV